MTLNTHGFIKIDKSNFCKWYIMTQMTKSKNITMEEIMLNVNARFITGIQVQKILPPDIFTNFYFWKHIKWNTNILIIINTLQKCQKDRWKKRQSQTNALRKKTNITRKIYPQVWMKSRQNPNENVSKVGRYKGTYFFASK